MEAGGVLIRLRQRENLELAERLRVDHGVGRTAGIRKPIRQIDRRIAREVRVAEVALRRRLLASGRGAGGGVAGAPGSRAGGPPTPVLFDPTM